MPELSAWMIPTRTRIQLDSYGETSVSFSPQQKHRIADNNKKCRGSGWQFHYSIIDRTNGLIILLKSLHFTSLQAKEKKREIFCFLHIYEEAVCAGIALCVCVRAFSWMRWLGDRKCIFFLFLSVYLQLFFASLFEKSHCIVVVVFLPLGSTATSPCVAASINADFTRRGFCLSHTPPGRGSCSDLPEFEDPAWSITLMLFWTRPFSERPGETVEGGPAQCYLCPVYCKYYWWLHRADEVAENSWSLWRESLQNVGRFQHDGAFCFVTSFAYGAECLWKWKFLLQWTAVSRSV